jgi:phosphoglycerate dehydrogenase-like enzyme
VAPNCLVISRYGVGVDNIPVGRATELGILVVNVPDFCLEEVSDHALALVLACGRRIVRFAGATREGRWDLADARGLPRLREQTLGLIGFGNIARTLVPKARGLGLRVLAYTPRLAPGSPEPGLELTNDFGYLLAQADYVSLHAPATSATRGLIGEEELRQMKPTAYLVNTSRGALVDERALERALREHWIAGAALDVLVHEPPSPQHPLLGLDNVIVTPHWSASTSDVWSATGRAMAEGMLRAARGEVPENVVNPEVLARPGFRAKLARFAANRPAV